MKQIAAALVGVILISGCQQSTRQARPEKQAPEIAAAVQAFQSKPGARYENDYAVPRQLLPLLQPGLSQDGVKEILGEPSTVRTNDQVVLWSYGLFYSMFIDIYFDEEGKLAKVSSPLLEE